MDRMLKLIWADILGLAPEEIGDDEDSVACEGLPNYTSVTRVSNNSLNSGWRFCKWNRNATALCHGSNLTGYQVKAIQIVAAAARKNILFSVETLYRCKGFRIEESRY